MATKSPAHLVLFATVTLLTAGCGSTDLDLEPNPASCVRASDCKAESGCAGVCICSSAGACVKGGACTVGDEVKTCSVGAICHNNTCIPIPTCINQTDCTPYGLHCNKQFNLCGRALTCTTGAVCKAPNSHCDKATGRCVKPTCTNGGVKCASPKSICNAQGACVSPGTPPPPGACKTHADCKKVGLKSCNGKGRCIKDGEHGDDCSDEKTDCRAGYYCCPILKRCFERCAKDGKCPDTGKKCVTVFINKLCVG